MTVYDRWMVVDPYADVDVSNEENDPFVIRVHGMLGAVRASVLVPHDQLPDWPPWVQQGLRDRGWRTVRHENFSDLTGMVESEHIPDWKGAATALAEAAQALLELDRSEGPVGEDDVTAAMKDMQAAVDRFRTTVMEESLGTTTDEPEEGDDGGTDRG